MSATGSRSSSSATIGRIQFVHPLIYALILFGMWICYAASSGHPLPSPWLQPLKDLGLFLFRTESILRGVFWLAFLAHVYEALLAARFASKIRNELMFIAFWTFQTALLGYPSLRIIKEQRRIQLKQNNQNKTQ